jgi:hypothetical protein
VFGLLFFLDFECKQEKKKKDSFFSATIDTIKELMSYPKCWSVKVINNPTRPGSNHREVNYINYK